MENKLHETGSVFGLEPTIEKPQGKPSHHGRRREPIPSSYGLNWTNPKASQRLVRWLMDIANTQEEYELLEWDLAELEALCQSCSNSLKGGAAQMCGYIR